MLAIIGLCVMPLPVTPFIGLNQNQLHVRMFTDALHDPLIDGRSLLSQR
jgi:hypothetical protein